MLGKNLNDDLTITYLLRKLEDKFTIALKSAVSALETMIGNLKNESFLFGTVDLIPDNTDLDTITDVGNYRGTSANTYPNSPVASMGFTLRVFRSTGAPGSNYRTQLWIAGWNPATNSTKFIYMRYTTNLGSTWSSWKRIVLNDDLADYVAKAGDTMSGSLNMKSGTLVDGTRPSTETFFPRVYFQDKNGANLGYVAADFLANGRQGIVLRTQRTISESLVNNLLALFINESGTRQVMVSEAAPWRSALGLGSSGALPITIAQGGTGQTEVTSTATVANIATAGTNFSITSAVYAQWGKLAMVNIGIKATAAASGASSGVTVATLVSGKRPAIPINAVVTAATSLVVFDTSGAIQVWRDFSANSTANIRGIFLLA